MQPSVSVLIPIFNATHTLTLSLNSVLSQTLQNIEIIAIDDGSTDNSYEILKHFSMTDSRIRLLKLPRTGLVGALNAGLHIAHGQFIARMDADDILMPQRLELQSKFLETHPDISVVSCQVEPFPENQITHGFRRYINWVNRSHTNKEIFADLFRESPLPHPSIMIRHEMIEKLNNYREFDGPEDYDLWLRLASNGARFARLPTKLLKWQIHSSSLSRTNSRYRTEAFRSLAWSFLSSHLLKNKTHENKPLWICGAGKSGRKLFKYLLKHEIEIHGFIDVSDRRTRHQLFNRPVLPVKKLPDVSRNGFLLFNVGNWGAVEKFESFMASLGKTPINDYLISHP
ncbi:glycosyltransferase [bacterium]|nr:glycosyltransferase [bacterium]